MLRHRIAVFLIGVLAVAGSVSTAGACSHGADAAAPTQMQHDGHAGHGATLHGGGTPAINGAGCDCGCDCAGTCLHFCQSWSPLAHAPSPVADADIALPAPLRAAVPLAFTHPPLRPPTASA